MRSVYDAIRPVMAVSPIDLTGTGSPTASSVHVIDTQGYNSAMFNIAVGTPTGTTTAITFTLAAKIQESSDQSTWSDVSGATASFSSTMKSAQIRVEGLGTSRQRYLQCVLTPAITPSTTAVLPVTATALLGRAFQSPASNSTTPA